MVFVNVRDRISLMKPLILMILDGWGIGGKTQANPINQVQTPTFDWMKKNFPYLSLQASGIAVGLPWGQVGDSEVGHLTLGAGRVIWQHYPRITMAIKDQSFFQNQALLNAFLNAKENKKKVHLIGLLSGVNFQASFEHLVALLEMAKTQGISPLLQLFTDGKETDPKDAKNLLKKLEEEIEKFGVGRLASLSGRFYAMDRDEHWERTEKVFGLLTEGGKIKSSATEILEEAYGRGLSDEYVEPSLIGKPEEIPSLIVESGDALIFFNFREDHARQLVQLFTSRRQDIFITTFTQYVEGLPVAVAFSPEKVSLPLGKVLSDAGKRQLRLAESEKSTHVTYFFNDLLSQPFPGEYWVIVPSPKTIKFGEHPELSAKEVENRLIEAMEEGVYEFILVNFANPDLIAHTGNFDASLKVVELMDRMLNRVANASLKLGVPLIVTSDHGNIEQMLDPISARTETVHNPSPVPFHLIDQRFLRERSEKEIAGAEKEVRGGLVDVAPTILELMGIPKPTQMTGQSLLKYCK